MTAAVQQTTASFITQSEDDVLLITLKGRFDATGVAAIWDNAVDAIADTTLPIVVDCGSISYIDGSGVALLLKIKEEAATIPVGLQLINVPTDHAKLINMVWENKMPSRVIPEDELSGFMNAVGKNTTKALKDARDMIAFVGESLTLVFKAFRHPSQVRWKDVMLACVHVGVDSLFILCLIGFLMGLIMSFQSAVTLRQFGGEIFIPNMLGVVMFREMGPLVTSILLAARSGSAFAAEIGTMKINEELDALTTMGLSPMRFMVLPKLIATLLMIPFMTIFFNIASLVGGALVMLSLGFPLATFTSRVFTYVNPPDFIGGLFKAFVFAMLVSGIGCLRGMQTKSGASAVGLSTTSAVVSGIILIAFADGIFAVTFYYLGW